MSLIPTPATIEDRRDRAACRPQHLERSLKEAAAETGMTVGALKVAVHRGLKALRAAMTGT
jgi:DNA-directed RNA polymerase specialized sigma24 family protein